MGTFDLDQVSHLELFRGNVVHFSQNLAIHVFQTQLIQGQIQA